MPEMLHIVQLFILQPYNVRLEYEQPEFPNEPLSSTFLVQLRSFPYAASCFRRIQSFRIMHCTTVYAGRQPLPKRTVSI